MIQQRDALEREYRKAQQAQYRALAQGGGPKARSESIRQGKRMAELAQRIRALESEESSEEYRIDMAQERERKQQRTPFTGTTQYYRYGRWTTNTREQDEEMVSRVRERYPAMAAQAEKWPHDHAEKHRQAALKGHRKS